MSSLDIRSRRPAAEHVFPQIYRCLSGESRDSHPGLCSTLLVLVLAPFLTVDSVAILLGMTLRVSVLTLWMLSHHAFELAPERLDRGELVSNLPTVLEGRTNFAVSGLYLNNALETAIQGIDLHEHLF